MRAVVTAPQRTTSPARAESILLKGFRAVLQGIVPAHAMTFCLLGPPGVGKTDLAVAAARVAGFHFVAIYLNVREPESLLGCYVPTPVDSESPSSLHSRASRASMRRLAGAVATVPYMSECHNRGINPRSTGDFWRWHAAWFHYDEYPRGTALRRRCPSP